MKSFSPKNLHTLCLALILMAPTTELRAAAPNLKALCLGDSLTGGPTGLYLQFNATPPSTLRDKSERLASSYSLSDYPIVSYQPVKVGSKSIRVGVELLKKPFFPDMYVVALSLFEEKGGKLHNRYYWSTDYESFSLHRFQFLNNEDQRTITCTASKEVSLGKSKKKLKKRIPTEKKKKKKQKR